MWVEPRWVAGIDFANFQYVGLAFWPVGFSALALFALQHLVFEQLIVKGAKRLEDTSRVITGIDRFIHDWLPCNPLFRVLNHDLSHKIPR